MQMHTSLCAALACHVSLQCHHFCANTKTSSSGLTGFWGQLLGDTGVALCSVGTTILCRDVMPLCMFCFGKGVTRPTLDRLLQCVMCRRTVCCHAPAILVGAASSSSVCRLFPAWGCLALLLIDAVFWCAPHKQGMVLDLDMILGPLVGYVGLGSKAVGWSKEVLWCTVCWGVHFWGFGPDDRSVLLPEGKYAHSPSSRTHACFLLQTLTLVPGTAVEGCSVCTCAHGSA
jgi:hypothetical protein